MNAFVVRRVLFNNKINNQLKAISVMIAIQVFLFGFLTGLGILIFFDKNIESTNLNFNAARYHTEYGKLQTTDLMGDTGRLNKKISPIPKKGSNGQYILPEIIRLEGNNSLYFTPRNNTKFAGCFTAGSAHPEPGMKWPCSCRPGYYGPNCAIPEVVMTSACQSIDNCKGIKARLKPRRIIHFLSFHHELDWIEVQLGELGDVVDVFVIGESNRTTSGEPNELLLLPKMKNEGFLKEYHSKILYVMIPSTEFPKDPKGGFPSDSFMRNYIGEKAFSRIEGIQDDDLIIMNDMDEIMNKDVLLFLKLHDGYPEPIKFIIRGSQYTFFWRGVMMGPDNLLVQEDGQWTLNYACTVGMVRQVFDNQIMLLRRQWDDSVSTANIKREIIKNKTADYIRDGKHNISDTFIMGRPETGAAAWHCTWCFRPEGIRAKWLGRNKEDSADWGPNKEKLDLKYIAEGLKRGNIFDLGPGGGYKVKPAYEGDLGFAPGYVWKHKEKFAYLLYPDAP